MFYVGLEPTGDEPEDTEYTGPVRTTHDHADMGCAALGCRNPGASCHIAVSTPCCGGLRPTAGPRCTR